jgi:hypothetical protein
MAKKKSNRNIRTKSCEHCGAAFRPFNGTRAANRFCTYACSAIARVRPLHERLNERIDTTTTPDGCHLWTGPVNNMHYGYLGLGRRHSGRALAHRAAWEQANGPVPTGLCVLHRCDTPRCCRVDHLFLGTMADNTHDCIAKGRHVSCRHAKVMATDD